MPFESGSCAVVAVQGGLHHLATHGDLELALAEMRRVARPDARIVIIEPWRTPFLDFVHWCCSRGAARRAWPKLDWLAMMIDEERETYERWLAAPEPTLALIRRHFRPLLVRRRWGKLVFLGSPREECGTHE
jgi:ubiquinone/menaquinone biosynthesis C-methylase UbiE